MDSNKVDVCHVEETFESNQRILERLKNCFGNKISDEVIEGVAYEDGYNIEAITNHLLEMMKSIPPENFDNEEIKTIPSADKCMENLLGERANSEEESACSRMNYAGSLASTVNKPGLPTQPDLHVQQDVSSDEANINRIINDAKRGIKMLILLRGLPGSGKSTLGRRIIRESLGESFDPSLFILSTDDFFVVQGEYVYDFNFIGDAHKWNQNRAKTLIHQGISPIIIDNTNTQLWEAQAYCHWAVEMCYVIEIVEPVTPWAFNIRELSRRNSHNVPRDRLRNMCERYEQFNIADLFQVFNLSYKTKLPPQPRVWPPIPKRTVTMEVPKIKKASKKQKTWKVIERDDETVFVSKSLQKRAVATDSEESIATKDNDNSTAIKTVAHDLKNPFNAIRMVPSSTNFSKITLQNEESPAKETDCVTAMEVDDNSTPAQTTATETTYHSTTEAENLRSIYKIMQMNFAKDQTKTDFLNKEVVAKDLAGLTIGMKTDDHSSAPETTNYSAVNSSGNSRNPFISFEMITPNKSSDDFDNLLTSQSANHSSATNTADDPAMTGTTDHFTMTDPNDSRNLFNAFKTITPRNSTDTFQNLPAQQIKTGFYNKGTMTEISDDSEGNIEQLVNVFEGIPREHIQSVFEECHNNMEYTIDTLLNSNLEMFKDYKPVPSNGEVVQKQRIEEPITQIVAESKKSKKKELSETELLIKQQIESNIVIDNKHYSQHILKLKGIENVETSQPGPSSSISKSTSGSDFEDLTEDLIDFGDSPNETDDESFEINLGEGFVEQIEKVFGDEKLIYPKGYLPIIDMPKQLAKNLMVLYLDSVFKQMEAQELILREMMKEDEELAKRLQKEEGEIPPEPVDLKQIMMEQKAQSIQEKINSQWKNLTPDDLAYKLTVKKLTSSFQEIASDVLIEILNAHNNNYNDTVESLLESKAKASDCVDNIKEAPLSDEVLMEMKKDHTFIVQNDIEDDKTANEFRSHAILLQNKRQELFNKAKHYIGRRQFHVAAFYTDLASEQTRKCEKYHNLAAEKFLSENFQRFDKFDLIDLHSLNVKEAINALDIFLDRNIMLMKGNGKKKRNELMIITGRGKNSPGGIPRIRPAVENRLKQRKLKYSRMNPGVVKVQVSEISVMTNDL